MFLEKTIEIRPDLPAVTFWLAALIFMVKGVQQNQKSPALRWHIFSGLCMGMAVMSTQKALFAFGGISLSLLWTLIDKRAGGSIKHRLKQAAVFLGGMMVPIALVCVYFLARHALWQFVNCNFIMNSRWKVKFRPYGYIKQLLIKNPFFSVIGIIGLLVGTVRAFKREAIGNGSFVLVLPTYALIAGLFVIPVPYRQYYLLFLPLLAIYCGFLFGTVDYRRLMSDVRNFRPTPLSAGFVVLAISLLAGGLIFVLRFSKPTIFGSDNLYLLLWAILIVSGVVALILNRSAYAVLFISLGIIACPLEQIVNNKWNKNDGQLAAIEYIMDATSPDDAVLDGWTGFGFLRDHAYFYFFLHTEMRAMLNQKELSDDLIESVEKKRAKIVVYDGSIKALPKKVRKYMLANFAPSGHGDIYVRKSGIQGR